MQQLVGGLCLLLVFGPRTRTSYSNNTRGLSPRTRPMAHGVRPSRRNMHRLVGYRPSKLLRATQTKLAWHGFIFSFSLTVFIQNQANNKRGGIGQEEDGSEKKERTEREGRRIQKCEGKQKKTSTCKAPFVHPPLTPPKHQSRGARPHIHHDGVVAVLLRGC